MGDPLEKKPFFPYLFNRLSRSQKWRRAKKSGTPTGKAVLRPYINIIPYNPAVRLIHTPNIRRHYLRREA